MRAESLERIRAHVAGESPLTENEWAPLLIELATSIRDGRAPDRVLIQTFLDMHPDRIDAHLGAAEAGVVRQFLDESVPGPEPERRAAMLLRVVAPLAPPPGSPQRPGLTAGPPLPIAASWLTVWQAFALSAAGVVIGLVVGMQIVSHPHGPAPGTASPLPGSGAPSGAASEAENLALLFPGYSPETYPREGLTRSVASDAGLLQASLWLRRRDGTYRSGDPVRLGYRVTQAAHAALIELSNDGTAAYWQLSPGLLVPQRTYSFPAQDRVLVMEGRAGPEDLMLVVASAPAPRTEIEALLATRVGPAGGERVARLDQLRDTMRAWAKRTGNDIAFARAHADIREPLPVASARPER